MKFNLCTAVIFATLAWPITAIASVTEITPQPVKAKKPVKKPGKAAKPAASERWQAIEPQAEWSEPMLRFHVPVTGPLLDVAEQRGVPRFNRGEPLAVGGQIVGWRQINGGHFLNADIAD